MDVGVVEGAKGMLTKANKYFLTCNTESAPIEKTKMAWNRYALTHTKGWGETTRTLVSWMHGFRHPTRDEQMSVWVGSPKT